MGFAPLLNAASSCWVTLYGALVAFVLLVLLPVALLARVPLRRFIAAVAEPVSIAFATTSSEAALPRAMEAMESIGVPRRIVAFVMPTGYSFNLDGTTLYLSLAAIFVAQAAGVPLTFGQQLLMVFTLMLTSKGVAGVPQGLAGDSAGHGGLVQSARHGRYSSSWALMRSWTWPAPPSTCWAIAWPVVPW